MGPQRHYTKSEWIVLFLSELAIDGYEILRPRMARAMAEQAMAQHPDLSPREALRLWRREASVSQPIDGSTSLTSRRF